MKLTVPLTFVLAATAAAGAAALRPRDVAPAASSASAASCASLRHDCKPQAPIDISVESDTPMPTPLGEPGEFTLTVRARSLVSSEPVHVQVFVSDDVKLVDGPEQFHDDGSGQEIVVRVGSNNAAHSMLLRAEGELPNGSPIARELVFGELGEPQILGASKHWGAITLPVEQN